MVRDRIRRFFLRCRRNRQTPETNQERPDIGIEPEVDYFALAELLIDNHGTGARAEAIRLTEEAMREEDQLAAQDWRAIAEVVALLANESASARH